MKKILLCFFLFAAAAVRAEVGVVTVTGTDAFTKAEDFSDAYDVRVPVNAGEERKCQAARVHRNWFFTAAHCVSENCKNGCKIKIILHRSNNFEIFTELTHTAKNPAVFFDAKYDGKKDFDNSASDIALLKYFPANQTNIYWNAKTGFLLTAPQFLAQAAGGAEMIRKAASRNNGARYAPIISFKNNYYKLNRTVSLISIDGAKKSVKSSGGYGKNSGGDKNPAYFLKDFGVTMAKNFGSKKGLSGSGVMTNTGELAGINSFGAGLYAGAEYAGFTAFDAKNLAWAAGVMGDDYGDLVVSDAEENSFAVRTEYSKLPETVKWFIGRYKKKK